MTQTESEQQVLVTLTGADHPGISAALLRVVEEAGARLIDIEQVVVHEQLILALLLGMAADRDEPVIKDLLFTARRLGLALDFKVIERSDREAMSRRSRYAVTCLSEAMESRAVGAVAQVLADLEMNIDTIRQLSEVPACFEVIVSDPAEGDRSSVLRRRLVEATEEVQLDLAVERESLLRRSKRLVVMDMDSTLIQVEVIDELARLHGVVDEVSATTARAMAGEIDFAESLRSRVALLKGLSYEKVVKLAEDLPLTSGAENLLRVLSRLGYRTGVISGGFQVAAEALKDRLSLDYAYANALEVKDGVLTGGLRGPIVTPQRKADLLDTISQSEGIGLEQTIAIGDGANDLAMLERAGLGVAFHAKAKLKAAADTSISQGGLDRVLFLLGIHARDVGDILGRP